MKNRKLNVGIIIGGKSVEHDISILSGLQVYFAIDKDKYDVVLFYINKNNEWLIGNELSKIETYENQNFKKCKNIIIYKEKENVYYQPINKKSKRKIIDLVIPVVHGANIEDGTLSGFLEMLDIPYTSSEVLASSIAQDKIVTKELLSHCNVLTVPYVKVNKSEYYEEKLEEIINTLQLPVIVKPAKLGSSIGIKTCYSRYDLSFAIQESFKYGNRTVVEKLITNFKEYNMAIIRDSYKIKTSCIEEVKRSDDILSFDDKYKKLDKLNNESGRIIPAIISPSLESRIQNMCIKAYNALDMFGVARIDCIYDQDNDLLYFNEINTIPGSLSFYLFEKGNVPFNKLIDLLIKNALLRRHQENKEIKSFQSNILNLKGTKLQK